MQETSMKCFIWIQRFVDILKYKYNFESFNLTNQCILMFQEILANIIEKGAQFTEMQYLNALQMSCKAKGITESNTLATYQQKLSDILGTKPSLGVTV